MRQLILCLLTVATLGLFYSCQKEVSLENGTPAKGSLLSSAGDCLPKSVAGSYVAAKALNDSNYIEVTVNVTAIGPYTITTDAQNGYSFKGTGNFAATGANVVRLKATGTPVSAGLNTFIVSFDSSFCDIAVTVLPPGSGGGGGAYTLVGAGSTCSFTPAGIYVKDSTLNASHTVSVQVNVTTVGSYSITTNTVNGYSFAAAGVFGATGPQSIILQGTGKPLAAGTNLFTATAGSSTCTFSITVSATAPASCGTAQGTFTAGTALTSANNIVITHNYAAAGPYTVTANTVNGYTFGPSAITAIVGNNMITLNGTGTPLAAGTNTFTVNFGDGTTCTFVVTVVAGTPVTNNDYFPLTANSYWTYVSPVTAPTDTIKKINNSTATAGGNTYRSFEVFDNAGASAYEEYYRRNGNDYFEYTFVDFYSQLTFDNDVEGDILFLKEGLSLNQTWMSAEFSGTEGGAAKKLRYTFKCIDPAATVTVNGKSYSNVYKVTMQPEVSTNGGTTWTAESIVWESWYAKGVGLVQQKVSQGANSLTTQSLRFYQVF